MGKAPADQFYWGDWLNDTGLQSATTVSRGVWINMLCRMWFAPIKGELSGTREELSKLCNANVTEFVTLENDIKRFAFADFVTDTCNDIVTVRNRRMYKKGLEQKNTHLRVKKHREKKSCNGNVTPPCNANVTVASSSSSSNTPIIPNLGNAENTSINGHPPYKEIRSLWCEILPSLPQPRPENTTWHTECRARYREYQRFHDEGSEWVKIFLSKFAEKPWWEGGKWKPPGIGWVWKRKNFYSILEAK